MRKILSVITVLLLIGVFLAGYWPQRIRRIAAEQNASQLKQQLTQAQSLVGICRVENDLLAVIEQSESQNYGEAQKLAGRFFDNLRAEADGQTNPAYKQALETVLGRRDAVTAALAKADPTVVAVLRQSLTELRQLVQSAPA